MMGMDRGGIGLKFMHDSMGQFFDFEGVVSTPPTVTFNGSKTISLGEDVSVELIELGPAHTAGDAVAWVPHSRTLYAGDLLFIGGTPIVWAGPYKNWITACERMVALNPTLVVPGHGT